MTLRDLLRLCLRRIGLIATTIMLAILGTSAYLWYIPAQYRATATGYVAVSFPRLDAANAGSFYSASQLANQKAQAFTSVIDSNAVAERVIEKLALSVKPADLTARITAAPVPDSATLRVSAVASTPDEARTIADCAIDVAAEEIRRLEGIGSPVQLKLLSSAELGSVTVSPRVGRALILGTAGGLAAGIALAVVAGLLDRKIRVASDIERLTKSPILAQLPHSVSIGRESASGSEQDFQKDFQSEETLRKLRTNLKFASVDHELKVCVVSSPNPVEGKSSVAFKLAQVMAAAGEDVVLVDADLRCPTVDKSFGVDGALGLSQVLAGSVTLDRALQKTAQAGLFVLPAGQIPPNPSELLGSQKMAELVTTLSRELFVILDAPPLLPVTDAAVLSRVASGVLLVVRSGKTKTDELGAAMENVERAGGRTVGIVLNGVPISKAARLKYGDTAYSSTYLSHYETSAEVQGSEADFDVRAATGRAPEAAVAQVKSFDEVVGEASAPRRRRPQFRPISGGAER